MDKIKQAIREGEELIREYQSDDTFDKIPDSYRGRHMELAPETRIAVHLLKTGAVSLNPENPYTWSSGWISPIYCDNRVTLSYPSVRSEIKNAIVDIILTNFKDVEAIVGVATAGIPQGCIVAEEMNLPFLYARTRPKEHGKENMIEGKLEPGCKVVIIEDLVSTGASSLKVVETIRQAGGEVIGVVTNFSYELDIAKKAFKDVDVELFSVTDYNTLIEIAKTIDIINEADLKMLKAWKKDPANWRN